MHAEHDSDGGTFVWRISWVVVCGLALGCACSPGAAASLGDYRLTSALDGVMTMERGTAGDGGVATELESLERELIAALNAERARAGVRELTASVKLARAADYHSSEMIQGDYFAHESLNGWSFHERLRKLARARTAGEVLAYETLVSGDDLTAQAVVELWMSSPEHRAEVLKRTYNRVGVGLRTGPFQGSETAAVFTVDLGRLH